MQKQKLQTIPRQRSNSTTTQRRNSQRNTPHGNIRKPSIKELRNKRKKTHSNNTHAINPQKKNNTHAPARTNTTNKNRRPNRRTNLRTTRNKNNKKTRKTMKKCKRSFPFIF